MGQTEEKGYFGSYGGSFVPPELQQVLDHLSEQFEQHTADPSLHKSLQKF